VPESTIPDKTMEEEKKEREEEEGCLPALRHDEVERAGGVDARLRLSG